MIDLYKETEEEYNRHKARPPTQHVGGVDVDHVRGQEPPPASDRIIVDLEAKLKDA